EDIPDLLRQRLLVGFLRAGHADGIGRKRFAEPGVLEKIAPARILAVARGGRIRTRAQQLLQIAGRKGRLDSVSRQPRAEPGLRGEARAARSAVHLEVRWH